MSCMLFGCMILLWVGLKPALDHAITSVRGNYHLLYLVFGWQQTELFGVIFLTTNSARGSFFLLGISVQTVTRYGIDDKQTSGTKLTKIRMQFHVWNVSYVFVHHLVVVHMYVCDRRKGFALYIHIFLTFWIWLFFIITEHPREDLPSTSLSIVSICFACGCFCFCCLMGGSGSCDTQHLRSIKVDAAAATLHQGGLVLLYWKGYRHDGEKDVGLVGGVNRCR